MFNPFRKKSFLEKCSDSVLGGLAAVGDVVVATGEIVGDAVDAITTPSQKREITIVHERPVIERKVVINTTTVTPSNAELEREILRLKTETMRIRQENLRMVNEMVEHRRREAEYEAAKERIAREVEDRMKSVQVVLDDTITTKRGNTYRVKLLLKGNEYKVTVKDCDLGFTLFDEVYYDAVRAYDAFSSRRLILKTK